MKKLEKLKKLNLKWQIILLIVFIVILLVVLIVKTPYPEFILNKTLSTTGDFIRVVIQFFVNIFR